MRMRAVVALLLIVSCLSIGCRNALSPNVDRNRAPETWLTGAPQDTLQVRNADGTVSRADIHTIPIRFRLSWAGSDLDGVVAGFYWAVVETLPIPVEGTFGLPPLPGPRTSQYRFTTRTDSVFTFTVSEYAPDRQHAFYIYAVDDKGKGDATPARFIFNALDRFPPLPTLYVSEGTGKVTRLLAHGALPTTTDTTVAIRDTVNLQELGRAPADTIPSGSRIDFRWHAEPTIAGGYAVKYKYKLDESQFVEVDSSVHAKSYNTGLGNDNVNPGNKQFNLRAFDEAGGARELTRRFVVNWSPDTWFAGPDSNLVARQSDTNDLIDYGRRYTKITNWRNLPVGGNSLLNCDSLYYLPSERKPHKTFWEIYRDKLYLRAENDTINMNGIVVLQAGGADLDSPYDVKVDTNDPNPDTLTCNGEPARVMRPSGRNGSPIAFRYQYTEGLDPNVLSTVTPSQSALFPLYDAASPFFQHLVNGYTAINQSGRVYLVLRAIDGNGATDERIRDTFSARLLTDDVDSGRDTDPYDVSLRKQLIMTFYVNRVPYFDVESPVFFPKPPENNNGNIAVSPDRVLRLNLPAIDPDPYDPATKPSIGGGPSTSTVLRTQVTVTGSYTSGGVTRDTTYITSRRFNANYNIDLQADAPYITGTRLKLSIQLCDCNECETVAGSGRCVNFGPILVDVPPPASILGGGSMARPTGTISPAPSSRSNNQ